MKERAFIIIVLLVVLTNCVYSETLKVTEEHPFLKDNHWVSAKELEVGDTFRTLGGKTAIVKSISVIQQNSSFFVYNLEVPFFNNFIVTLDKLVVHNSNPISNPRFSNKKAYEDLSTKFPEANQIIEAANLPEGRTVTSFNQKLERSLGGKTVYKNTMTLDDGSQVVFYSKEERSTFSNILMLDDMEAEAEFFRINYEKGRSPNAMIVDSANGEKRLMIMAAKGEPLNDFLKANPSKRAEVYEEIGKTLREMHDDGILHGDLNSINAPNHIYPYIDKETGKIGIEFIDFGKSSRIDFPTEYAIELGTLVDSQGTNDLSGLIKEAYQNPSLERSVNTRYYNNGNEVANTQSISRLGDLEIHETYRIQKAADTLGKDIYVGGSAASANRRGVGSNLPLAEFGGSKVGTRSDIDYMVKNGYDDSASELDLPDLDSSWGVRGVDYLNLDKGDIIKFSPGKEPEVISGIGKVYL